MKSLALEALKQIEVSADRDFWEAHGGCAVLAGAFLIEEGLVDEDARAPITSVLERILAKYGDGRSERPGNPTSLSGEIFRKGTMEALASGADKASALGHDVIYTAYILKALRLFKITPWESLLDATITLVRKVKAAGPGWITVNEKDEFRKLDEADAGSGLDYWTLFSRFDRSAAMESRDMQLGHLLTHGHAIQMVQEDAGPDLVADLDLAFRKRLQALRLANAEQTSMSALPRRQLDPRKKKYWELVSSLGDMHGHAVKYAYSFLDLRKVIRLRPI